MDMTSIRLTLASAPALVAFWDRITFYQSTFALLEALFGIENHDPAAFESGIEDYV